MIITAGRRNEQIASDFDAELFDLADVAFNRKGVNAAWDTVFKELCKIRYTVRTMMNAKDRAGTQ